MDIPSKLAELVAVAVYLPGYGGFYLPDVQTSPHLPVMISVRV